MLTVNRLALGLLVVLLAACSAENGSSAIGERNGHVWKAQTNALEKVKQVEGLLGDAAMRHLRASD